LLERGYIQIYTGDGKGKTTCAIGLAIRATGYDKQIAFIQFFKLKSGEDKILKMQKNILFKKFGCKKFIINKKILPEHKKQAKKGIDFVLKILNSNKKIDILILDEINIVIYYNLASIKTINEIINKCKQKNIELIFTGRNAKKAIIDKADLVTEMKIIKHYFPETHARKGIEY